MPSAPSTSPVILPTRITIGQAAQVLGLSKDSVRRMISGGILPADRIAVPGIGPKPIRLLLSDVEACARRIATTGSEK